ncbi:hypothetical protein QF026_000182 [Streptomyces aurantiacus]|nr:hypothetical protein [Streptomyces aurantiacus]
MSVWTMAPLKVRRSTMAAQSRGSVTVFVQPSGAGSLGQFIDELGGQHVADAEAVHGRLGAQGDQEVGLADAGVSAQAERLALLEPFAGGEGVDGGRVDAGVGVEVEHPQALDPGEGSGLDPAFGASAGPVVALGHQQFGEEGPV